MNNFKSGFVTIIGRPNVGKSTLINKIIGEKVAITSNKPQTTRNKLQAIYTNEKGQIVFVDTPGIHKPNNELDNYMLQEAYKSLKDIDLIIFMLDATANFGSGDKFILEQIKGIRSPIIPLLNKTDKLNFNKLKKVLDNYERNIQKDLILISARTGKNVDELLEKIINLLPEGPRYYPEDMYTDQLERFLAGEIIREKIFKLTREEIPYGVAVLVEEMKERQEGKMLVRANIYVEKKSHKGIIIGKNGMMLKKIGSLARKELEKILHTKIYLDLWVKIEKNWRDDKKLLRRLGYKE